MTKARGNFERAACSDNSVDWLTGVDCRPALYQVSMSMAVDQNQPLPPDPSPPLPPGAGAEPNVEPISSQALKSAYNAFKKRWKLTRLDYESRIGRGPLSSGQKSAIVGIAAPKEYPRAVWEELVKQGRLKHAGSGLYAMP
jgi:hypothetical protein